MPRRKRPSVEDLKVVLRARFMAAREKQRSLEERILQALGLLSEPDTPRRIEIRDLYLDWISGLLARRLSRNRRSVPLISERDFESFGSILFKTIGKGIDSEQKRGLERLASNVFHEAYSELSSMVPPRKNAYIEHWRWIEAVYDLALEHHVLPPGLFSIKGAEDEIARALFTKNQFLAMYRRAFQTITDANALNRLFLSPALELLAGDDEKSRREVRVKIKSEVMPELRKIVAKIKPVVNDWIEEEAGRIYSQAA